ncbi:MAG: thioredoxin family protein [Leptospiraceae bacterium]|nr:thioredoxin family protein [Leptospiraceae bacterium]MCP5499467.1 thioredoxin family protein [Leptospiraceae bacterium]
MKKIFYLLTIFLFPSFLFAEIPWKTSILEALKEAREKNQPIILDLYTDWCGYCKVLEKKIFPQEPVQKALKEYIPVRLNAEKFPNLVSHYGVKGYPTVLLLDKSGNLIGRITGLPSEDMLVKKMKEAYEYRDTEKVLLGRLKDKPDDTVNNFNLGVYYYRSGEKEKAKKYFYNSYGSKDSSQYPEQKHDSLYNMGIIDIESGNYSEAVKTWTYYMEQYPKRDHTASLYYRGKAYNKLGKYKEAKADFHSANTLTGNEEDKEKIDEALNGLPVH